MMASAETISAFVHKHPTVKMLALSFLLLIGMSLILEGFDHHIPKGYIYFAMGFSVFVEMINLRLRKATKPVHLPMNAIPQDRRPLIRPGSLEGPLMSCLMLGDDRGAGGHCGPGPRAGCPSACTTRRRGTFTDFESMVGRSGSRRRRVRRRAARRRGTHRLEEALLGGLLPEGRPTVSLEMFERDVQGVVDGISPDRLPSPSSCRRAVRGPGTRPTTARSSRWRRARAGRSWRPTCRAGCGRREIRGAGDRTTARRRPRVRGGPARMPHDAYFCEVHRSDDRSFAPENKAGRSRIALTRGAARHHRPLLLVAMRQGRNDGRVGGTGGHGPGRQAGSSRAFHGAFHTDFGAGTAERTRRRLPGRRLAVVSILPVADLDASPRGRRSEAGGLSGLYAESALRARGSRFGKASADQRQRRSDLRLLPLITTGFARTPNPRTRETHLSRAISATTYAMTPIAARRSTCRAGRSCRRCRPPCGESGSSSFDVE